jgi:8-oxo-dGTP pyrophosphatase MutT (NUDIX family)
MSNTIIESSCNGPRNNGFGLSGEATAVRVAVDVALDVALMVLSRRTSAGEVEILVARRHASSVRGGLWEYPGGKVEMNEAPVAAALREVCEETGLAMGDIAGSIEPLIIVDHTDPELARERTVRLHAFVAELTADARPEALGASEIRFVALRELDTLSWPAANAAAQRHRRVADCGTKAMMQR